MPKGREVTAGAKLVEGAVHKDMMDWRLRGSEEKEISDNRALSRRPAGENCRSTV